MSLAERSQTIGIVLDRVLLATDPKEPQIEEADGTSENAFPHQPPATQVTLHPLTQSRQGGAKIEDTVELQPALMLMPPLVVRYWFRPASS